MFNKWVNSIRMGYTLRPLRKGGVSGCGNTMVSSPNSTQSSVQFGCDGRSCDATRVNTLPPKGGQYHLLSTSPPAGDQCVHPIKAGLTLDADYYSVMSEPIESELSKR